MKKLMFALVVLALLAIPSAAYAGGGGFDQYGYNYTARLFNGTGSSWCLAREASADCLGIYSPDKLIMKWNAAWDACNAAGNNNVGACLGAWTDNEWNGQVPGGSGVSDHYKIIWVGTALESSPYWRTGGYAVWGEYEVIMDQGVDPSSSHIWWAHAIPTGYGSNP
jgi:hypothetical protein